MTPTAAAEGARRRSAARFAQFALFAECLLTGVWLVVAALPLVTALPAFAAACGHLRRHLDGERSTWRDFAAETVAATRAGWGRTLVWWGALALLGLDLAVARSGALPGGGALTGFSVLAAVALVVTGLRAAALWRPGEGGRGAAGRAVRRCAGDPGGTLLLAGGAVVAGVAAWMLLPLGAVALGCVAGAAVAVERRAGG
ncbi:hypothetical protein OG539_10740 [Actinacidiphila glaucinigra]|uniref:hypothetical protein n=1 Tax=Actinacidiphila glaucinigra TaxID=235986 RepID=UPI00324D3849